MKPAKAPTNGLARIVFVHSTFSNSDDLINDLLENPQGPIFLERAAKHYKGQVYTFDHPTLAVSPILNALDLAREFENSRVKVDIVCHSRGGLVGRWRCERVDSHADRCRKAILVGSPLAGTGLAAPPNIRSTISLLTTIVDGAEKAAGLASFAVPVLSIVELLLKVVTSITGLAAKTPVVDAAMAMVPGLLAMSRVGNNPELLRLLEDGTTCADRYFAVASNFEPTDPLWEFWRVFRKNRLANIVADAIFDGDNDLVVDTPSMTRLADKLRIPSEHTLDFGTSETVHHLNYFAQAETTDFLTDTLL